VAGLGEFADDLLRDGCPSLLSSEEDRRWFANWLRVGASPAVAYALNRAFNESDLGDVLPAVHVPTLVLYRSTPEDAALAMDVAALIPSARAMRVSGSDYFGIFLSLDIVDELERFIAREEAPFVPESVLTTLMFTDLVASTERPPNWVTEPGATCSHSTTRSYDGSWAASAARSATRPATASSRRSTARRARSAPARRSSRDSTGWGWTRGSAFIPANASSTRAR